MNTKTDTWNDYTGRAITAQFGLLIAAWAAEATRFHGSSSLVAALRSAQDAYARLGS